MKGAFVAMTVGGVLAYSGLKGLSVLDVLSGKQGSPFDPTGGRHNYSPSGTAGDTTGSDLPHGAAGSANISGTATFEGVTVAKWILPHLQYARAHGWQGKVTSGYRDPQYSRQLCLDMCGAPSCPGTCAGTSSNHGGKRWPRGAVDVSDQDNFGRIVAHSPHFGRLINRLPKDRVHYSQSGG